VIVTGGNGFVGYHVINELNKANCFVISIDEADHRDDIEAVQHTTSLHDPELPRIFDFLNPDYVIHLAATHYIPYCNAHPIETFHNNVMGTASLLAALPDSVRGLFIASSAAVYEPSLMPHSESSPTWPTDVYGLTKVATEYLARKWGDDTNKAVCLGRYFNMYGWGETTPHLIPVVVSQVLSGSKHVTLGNVTTRRDYVRVEDNARATVALTLSGYRGAINLGTGISYSAMDIVRIIGQIHGADFSVSTDESRVRKVDRPNLVSDMTVFNLARLLVDIPQPLDINSGLEKLLETGIGPYMKEPG